MRASLVLTAFVALGCNGSIPLRVDLITDLRPGIAFSSVRTRVTFEGAAQEMTVTASREDDFFTGRRVGDFDMARPGSMHVLVSLLDVRGQILAERATIAEVRGATSVTVLITSDCVNVDCPSDPLATELTECLGGRCVPPECVVEDTSACPPFECDAAADCLSALFVCGDASACIDGYCFTLPNDALCSPGEYCDPATGCTLIPDDVIDGGIVVDGGGLDAGSIDAGIECRPGGACSTGNECERGVIDCSDGSPRCVLSEYVVAGFPCSTGVCDGYGLCVPCAAGTPCSTGNPCQAGVFACAIGGATCVGAGPAGAGTVCRAAAGLCDVEELCTGDSESCPPDAFRPDGLTCGPTWSENACGPIAVDYCMGGTCTHRAEFVGDRMTCNDIGLLCGMPTHCCTIAGRSCIMDNQRFTTASNCAECCPMGHCCVDGIPGGDCI